jgi:hypothetical protein
MFLSDKCKFDHVYKYSCRITAVSNDKWKYSYEPVEKHNRLEDDTIASVSKTECAKEFGNERYISRNQLVYSVKVFDERNGIILHFLFVY